MTRKERKIGYSQRLLVLGKTSTHRTIILYFDQCWKFNNLGFIVKVMIIGLIERLMWDLFHLFFRFFYFLYFFDCPLDHLLFLWFCSFILFCFSSHKFLLANFSFVYDFSSFLSFCDWDDMNVWHSQGCFCFGNII